MAATGQQITVDGRTLRLTNLDKVLFAETGTTKAEMLHYYSEIAPLLLPQLRDRPVTRKRWPEGAGHPDGRELVFFTKNVDSGTPDWVRRVRIEHSDRPLDYPVVDDLATLTFLAQLAAVELHVPQWRFDAAGRPGNPDRLVLDLDPGPGVGLAECALVARSARDLLAELDHVCVPVTSGSKGIHLYAALDGSRTSDEISRWARDLAELLRRLHPDLVISVMRRSERAGKVFLDWSQNNGAKTTIAPYSLRGRGRPWVAAPRTWDELDDPDLAQLELAEVLARAAEGLDPMAVLEGASGGAAIGPAASGRGTSGREASGRGTSGREATGRGATGQAGSGSGSPRFGNRRTGRTAPQAAPASTTGPGRTPPAAPTPTPTLELSPMMASAPSGRGSTFTRRGRWQFELKWDGVRALVAVDADGVRLTSRRRLDMTATYPELVPALAPLGGRRVVLDTEVVALDEQGRTSFGLLQQRINLSRPADVRRVARSVPVQLICFDLLVLDGEPVLAHPYEERRRLLEELVTGAELDPRVQVPPDLGDDFEAALEVSRTMGSEGLVAKRCGSRYHPGARSEDWLKIKNVRTQDVVVVGWKAGQGGRADTLGSLVMAVPDDDGWRYVGRVGSGFTHRGLVEAEQLLADLTVDRAVVGDVPRADSAGVTWVRPELVGEVEYMDWTSTGRLRHPTWRGWRPDRAPEDVVAEDD